VGTEQITVNRHEGQSNSLVESTKGKWKGKQEIVQGRFPANLILSYPEDEYTLKDNVAPDELRKLAEYLDANA